jgi:hypothetical protein
MSLRVACFAAGLALASADKLIDFEEGSLFTKCLKITDLETKSIEDDIELVERDASGCCPNATVPGVKHTNMYVGPQVVCGLKDDGTISLSTGSSNGVKTCTYNSCFVMKQNLECEDGSKQRINGCCAPKADCAGNNCGFKELCKNYNNNFNNAYSESADYCTVYHKNYGTVGNEGTSLKTDDVDMSGDAKKLVTDKVYVYARCEGGSSGSSSLNDSLSGAVKTTASGSMMAVAVLLAVKVALY